MGREQIVRELEKSKSILMLLLSDIDNPRGESMEDVQIGALECAIDQLSYGIDMIEQIDIY